jgi:cell division protein FtsB
MKKITINIIAIVFAITFTSIAFAGKGNDQSPIDNGNAWWKNNACVEIVDSLEANVDQLESENAALRAEIELLREQVVLSTTKATVQQPLNAEANLFQIRQTSEDHPNTPDITGISVGMLVNDQETISKLVNSSTGTYDVTIKVITPDGEEIFISSTLSAAEAPFKYSNYFLNIIK